MIFVNKINVAHTRSVTNARSIDAAVVADRFSRRTKLTEKTKLTTEFNLVIGNVAYVRIGLTYEAQAVTGRRLVCQANFP